jgi:GNAT superfamily N-acetyltransferase
MTALTPTIRKVIADDVPHIAGVLSRAFHDDPTFRWWIPDDERRRQTLPGFFVFDTNSQLGHDEVYVDVYGVGAAIWVPPMDIPPGEAEAELFGRWMQDRVSVDEAGRVFELLALFEEHHPHEPHYYLDFMGVEPERQGKGIGSALMAPVLERCDHLRIPAYTEATSPRNRRFYARHGFVAVGEIAPASGPPLWPMWREPVTP